MDFSARRAIAFAVASIARDCRRRAAPWFQAAASAPTNAASGLFVVTVLTAVPVGFGVP